MTKPTQADTNAKGKSSRRRHAFRWSTRVVVFSTLLVALALAVLTKTAVLKAVILPQIASDLNCTARCSNVRFTGSGRIEILDLALSNPSIEGPAATFFTAPRVVVQGPLHRALFGRAAIASIRVVQPLLRLSQDEQLRLNVSDVLRSGRGAGADRIPDVHITHGVLELGEHRGADYSPVLKIPVDGSMTEQPRVRGRYDVLLTEFSGPNADPQRSPLRILGQVDLNLGAIDLAVEEIDLSSIAMVDPRRSGIGYWRAFRIDGRIPRVTVIYRHEERLQATFDLDDVDLTIPVPTTTLGDDGIARLDTSQPLAMNNVEGRIAFDRRGLAASLYGTIQDLACRVELKTQGLTLDAPFTCAITADRYQLEKEPGLLPFAPGMAHRILQRFSGPTATLAGDVTVRRNDEGVISYSGAMEFRNGEGRYEAFPYHVQNIEALFEFDQDLFRVTRFSGTGPTGAKLLAYGEIGPPGAGAAVDLEIFVTDAPLDEHFHEALPDARRAVFDTLFDLEALDRLVADGLVVDAPTAERLESRSVAIRRELASDEAPDEARPALEAELATITTRLEAPRFDLGGPADLAVRVTRPFGLDQRYATDVTLRLKRAGVLLNAFPFPVHAEDVTIRLADGKASIEPFDLTGLSGGGGTLKGVVVYEENGQAIPVEPNMEFRGAGVPIDELFIRALPETADTDTAPFDAAAFIRDLRVAGTLDFEVWIKPSPEETLDFEVVADLRQLRASPVFGDLVLEDLRGRVEIERGSIRVPELVGSIGDGRFAISLDARAAEGEWTVRGAVVATELDLEAPIEGIVAYFSPEQAAPLEGWRERFDPRGVADARVDFHLANDGLDFLVTVDRLAPLSLETPFGRTEVITTLGRLAFRPQLLSFQDLHLQLQNEDASPTVIALDGVAPLGTGAAPELTLHASHARFESPGIRWAAARVAPGLTETIIARDPRGEFELRLAYDGAEPADPVWSLHPASLRITRQEQDIRFDRARGVVRSGDGGTVAIEELRLDADAFSLGIDGTIIREPIAEFDGELSVDATELSPELLALLPAPAMRALMAIDLRLVGRMKIDRAPLTLAREPGSDRLRGRFEAIIRHTDLSLDTGLTISTHTGYSEVSVQTDPTAGEPHVAITVHADRFEAGGATLTNGVAEIRSVGGPEDLLLRRLDADLHGGRLTGRGRFADAGALGFSEGGLGYEVHVETSGVDFGALIDDLGPDGPVVVGSEEAEGPPDRGMLDMTLSLAGAIEAPQRRRGRCSLRVQGGDVLQMPGVMPVLELSNLQPPMGETVDLAFADCFIRGGEIGVDQLSLFSDTIRIAGVGVIMWPSLELDLAVEARGVRHLPVISQFVEALRGEIASTRVSGTLKEPEFRLEQLASTRQLLGVIFGEDSPQRPRPPN